MLATRLQTAREKPPLFTIHQSANNIMAVRLKERHDIKTCVVSFSNHTDAFRIAKLIETHKETYQEWPNFNFDDSQLDDVLSLSGRKYDMETLKELVINEWDDIESLVLYCASNFMDLMNMKQIEEKDTEGNFKLQGHIHKLEVADDFIQMRLEDIFQISM
jgi:hypothetical protein